MNENDILTFEEECKKSKEEKKKRLIKGDFKILITTSMFLYKNYKDFPRNFSFIFIDDVDSFLKTAKNIDKVLYLMGFEEEDINLAMELIKEKAKQNRDLQKIEHLSQKVKKISQKKRCSCCFICNIQSKIK